HLVDVGDRARDPFAEVALGVAVAQLDRFMFAGRSAAGHRRATARARSQRQIAFHRGVAAGIKYLARRERSDGIHELILREEGGSGSGPPGPAIEKRKWRRVDS